MRTERAPFGLFPKKLACESVVYYYSTYDTEGRRRQFSTGYSNRREAEQEVLKRFAAGKLVPTDPCLFRKWTADWFVLGHCPYLNGRQERGFTYSPVHARNRRALLVNYLWPAFGDQTIQSIKSVDIERELLSLGQRGKSRDLQNRCLETLSVVLEEAVRLEVISSNPARKVPRFAHTSKEKGTLSEEEADRVFDPIRRSLYWRDHGIAYWALLVSRQGGLRQGELMGLQVEDLTDDGIKVCHGWDRLGGLKGTKTGKSRFVPLPRNLMAALKELSQSGHVFSLSAGERPFSATYLRKAFIAALERSGIPRASQVDRNLGTHSLRHALVSRLLGEGTPVAAVAQLVGHQTLTLTAGCYHHQTSRHIQEIRLRMG